MKRRPKGPKLGKSLCAERAIYLQARLEGPPVLLPNEEGESGRHCARRCVVQIDRGYSQSC